MNKYGVIVLLLLLVFSINSISFASADFSLGKPNYSITKEYGPSSTLKGWLNISFDDEQGDSLLSDSLGNSISLIELLKKNPQYSRQCNTFNCSSNYEGDDLGTQSVLSLSKNDFALFGFKVSGNIESIESANFTLESNAPTSCNTQFEIDFLNDGTADLKNTKLSLEPCSNSKNYGCFNQTSTKEFVIGRTPYCQKINLTSAPGFRIGAYVKKIGPGNSSLIMGIYLGVQEIGECTPPNPGASGQEVYCDVSYLVESPKDHYVCIYSNSNTEVYSLLGSQSPSNKCGFYGDPWNPVKTETSAYHIFSQPLKFDSPSSLNIFKTLKNETLSGIFENYLNQATNLNCSGSNGCIIPVKIKAYENQNINLKNLKLTYEETGGKTSSTHFYELTEIPPEVNSRFGILKLDDAKLLLPSAFSNITYRLSLDSDTIFSEKISITEVPTVRNLIPRSLALGFPTLFILDIKKTAQNSTIIRYEWDFDGDKKTTTTNEITYAYRELGTKNITITITDSKQRSSSQTFQVEVFTPEEHIEKNIERVQSGISNVKSVINSFPIFYQNSLEDVVDIESAENSLIEVQRNFSTATTNEEYLMVVDKLLSIKIPESIRISETAPSIPFLPQQGSIDVSFLEGIGAGSANGSESDYADAILSWNYENLDTKITYNRISVAYSEIESPALNVFEIDIDEKGNLTSDPYLVIKDLENLKFNGNYSQLRDLGYYYIVLKPGLNNIEFSTTEEIDFSTLPAFISPSLDEIKPGSGLNIDTSEVASKIGLLILLILLVGVISLIVYVVLQQWYKYKYETHLFKNRNNLFNLVTFINNQKRNGVLEKEIIKKLKRAGWSSEQLAYAIKKYVGKRTGMLELIPIDKIFGRRKKEQIDPRNPFNNRFNFQGRTP